MTRRNNAHDTRLTIGIDCEAIIADRRRGVQTQRYTCGCGGRVIQVEIRPLSETFRCEQCRDLVVILIRSKTADSVPRYAREDLIRRALDGETYP